STDLPTPALYSLSLHDALPILAAPFFGGFTATAALARSAANFKAGGRTPMAAVFHAGMVLLAVVVLADLFAYLPMSALAGLLLIDRKSTRLNSSHVKISYAVFC